MKIEIPAAAREIIAKLEHSRQQAFVVGGCVRDSCLGKAAQDWDICSSALPEEIMRCLSCFRLIETGRSHGTIGVLAGGELYEVTTFRRDGTYSDHRHPDRVEFVSSLQADLSRRDFTINAMAYHPDQGILDPFGGQADLAQRVIRCVGEPDARFQEDALRMMRALRFASVLDFEISRPAKESILHNKSLLQAISAQRLQAELRKLLLGKGVAAVLQDAVMLLSAKVPELGENCFLEEQSVQRIAHSAPELAVRLSLLLDAAVRLQGEQSAKQADLILERLKFDRKTQTAVRELLFYQSLPLPTNSKEIKHLLEKMGQTRLRQFIEVKRAEAFGQTGLEEEALACLAQILEQGQCFSLRDLAVHGQDLIQRGVPQGRQVGEILAQLLELVLEERLPNEKDALLEQLNCFLSEL